MATGVEFHTGLEEPLVFACRLLRKAIRSGSRVACTAPPATLEALDRALWTFDERDFVPHVRLPGASATLIRRTPIWLAADLASVRTAGPGLAERVLVNLGAGVVVEPGAHPRVIEVVGADAQAAAAGRERWRRYKAAGFEVRHYAAIERERP
jgi:DNA polymerase-3 subunit chi